MTGMRCERALTGNSTIQDASTWEGAEGIVGGRRGGGGGGERERERERTLDRSTSAAKTFYKIHTHCVPICPSPLAFPMSHALCSVFITGNC